MSTKYHIQVKAPDLTGFQTEPANSPKANLLGLYVGIFLLTFSPLYAQKSKSKPIPRDTSFTVYQTFVKEQKNFPEIKIAQPEKPDNVVAREGLVYSVIEKTAYGKRELQLNLYRPDDGKVYPALLMVHGGGWNSGDLTLQIPMALQIAAKGYVTVPVEYRLIPEALYPAAVHDLKAAVCWLRANADRYGIDPSRIAISGCSAGGQLANLVGMTNRLPNYERAGSSGNVPSEVQAVINIDGLSDFTVPSIVNRARELRASGAKMPVDAVWLGGTYEEKPEHWKSASPIYWVSEKSAPVCFINSSIPRFHEGRDAQIAKLDSLGIYSEVHTLGNTPHPFWLFHPWFKTTVNYMANFLDKTFKPTEANIPEGKYNFVVAQDGSGDFTTVQEAIDAVPDFRKKETVIFIRNGVYREKVVVAECKKMVVLIGEDPERTMIMYDDYSLKKNIFGEEKGTSGSAGFYTYGTDFTAINICFENTAGPVGQAVAMYVLGDRSVFYNCRFLGYQDTLYAAGNGARQYYLNCYIEGTTDFIFGSGTAWFEGCRIYCKVNSYITAANTPKSVKYGYIFNNCTITVSSKVTGMYFGRPWRPYAMTVFMNTYVPAEIRPEGWHNWDKASNEQTARYMECNNFGPGAGTAKRAGWVKILMSDEASEYTLANVMQSEEEWSPLAIIEKYRASLPALPKREEARVLPTVQLKSTGG